MKYGQFCPISKANEILGEKWTILIIRELLMGARRFNELQRGLGLISPALLTSRLKSLEDQGLIARLRISGQKGYEYVPTQACRELLPVLTAMGEWGLCWARHNLNDDDYDVDFLMYYLERSIDPEQIVGDQAVIKFQFTDLKRQKNWWLVVQDGKADLCIKDPGRDVDVFFTTTVRTMADVWMGDRPLKAAIKSGDLIMQGAPAMTRNVNAWLKPSIFADSPRTPRDRPTA
jgi:DNA-binding HxlR family transcriptional regulator